MGLKDLRKQSAPIPPDGEDKEAQIQAFISGAPVTTAKSVKRKRKPKATYKRLTFSLSESVEKDILKLSRVPRTFAINKSQVVRAGVLALMEMDRAVLLAVLERAVKGESAELSETMVDEE
ncbi:hypothetical protein FA213_27325 [Pseudomonas aeruginosa]|uniref:hypothetical protein n=1 Tax=Pseudomonas aeruginosa group TaxID=136841 RepID=UPI000EACAB4B|nr:hypothetical protein [Pseudomonas aeruginosa]MCG0257184.1 hypothetical protein [Pseudomonas aeruginosa]MCO3240080.1 hypothetical protein [Pseudomonas aeruginosa]MCO3246780.1 hypothetical protein [Pseudomonas aeruginosa]TEC29367.1 hypothetical protein IPC1593_30335 [Pseudomonas aeruginosa]HCE7957556.1 hypothetical protein [Pseudomonas aeruginosa]